MLTQEEVIMSDATVHPTVYQPERFIGRSEELGLIKTVLCKDPPSVRHVQITGERGFGKTWLALHLHRAFLKSEEFPPLESVLINFYPLEDGNDAHGGQEKENNECFFKKPTGNDLNELLSFIAKAWQVKLPTDASNAEIVHRVKEFVHNNPYKKFVFILDSVFEAEQTFMQQFEREFLAQVMPLLNAYAITTGRGNPYPWVATEMQKVISSYLGPFEIDDIKQQIEKLGLKGKLTANQILVSGAGAPILTRIFLETKTIENGIKEAANLLFAVLPDKNRTTTRIFFEALSALDGFREENVGLALAAYFNDPGYQHMNLQDIRSQVLDPMKSTNFLVFAQGKFQVKEPVLTVLRKYLVHVQPEIWKRLHCQMAKAFLADAENPSYKKYADFYCAKARFHEEKLQEVGAAIADCPETKLEGDQ